MNAYAQVDRDYDKQITKAHEDQEQIEYIEYQAQLIIDYIKSLSGDQLKAKIGGCLQEMNESYEVIQ